VDPALFDWRQPSIVQRDRWKVGFIQKFAESSKSLIDGPIADAIKRRMERQIPTNI
jgi:hypothetical protein